MTPRAVLPSRPAPTGTSRQPRTAQALLGGDPLDGRPGGRLTGVVVGQERAAHGVGTAVGQLEGHGRAQERVGDLGEDAGAVAGVRLAAGGPAVVEVAQGGQGLVDDLVARLPGQGRDEGNAARVVLVRGRRTGPEGRGSVRPALVDGMRPSSSMAQRSSTEGRRWPCGSADQR